MAKIAHLLKDRRSLPVDLGEGETLNVVYRPGAVTPTSHDETIELVGQQRVGAALAQSLATTIVSWDLVGDNNTPIKPDVETLRDLPVRFLDMVLSAIQADIVPNAPKPKGSGGSF